MQRYIFFSKTTNKYYKIFILYISILCMLTKSEMTITELVDLSENCSRKSGASDESDKSVISKKILYSSSRTLTSCLHVFLSKKHGFMSSCLKTWLHVKTICCTLCLNVGAGLRRDTIASQICLVCPIS